MEEKWLKEEVSEPLAYFGKYEIPIDEIIEKIAAEYRSEVWNESEKALENIHKNITKEIISRLEGIILEDPQTLKKNIVKIYSLILLYISVSRDLEKYKNVYDFLADLQQIPNVK